MSSSASIVVGGGISALQHLDEISRVATTTWVTRREPQFREGPFTPEDGRAAVAIVEDRRGLVPGSVVSVTGIPLTPALEGPVPAGVLNRLPMFNEITEHGVRWADGFEQRADVILWATGFRSSLDHLAPLRIREDNGGIIMSGRLATQVGTPASIWLATVRPHPQSGPTAPAALRRENLPAISG